MALHYLGATSMNFKKKTYCLEGYNIKCFLRTKVAPIEASIKDLHSNLEGLTPSTLAHWSWIGAYGGWDDSRLKEFDKNHLTKNQVFIYVNDFLGTEWAQTYH